MTHLPTKIATLEQVNHSMGRVLNRLFWIAAGVIMWACCLALGLMGFMALVGFMTGADAGAVRFSAIIAVLAFFGAKWTGDGLARLSDPATPFDDDDDDVEDWEWMELARACDDLGKGNISEAKVRLERTLDDILGDWRSWRC